MLLNNFRNLFKNEKTYRLCTIVELGENDEK